MQAARLSAEVWLCSIPVGLLAANILVVNNYRDAETDAAAGKRTLVVRFGRRFSRWQFGSSLLLAFVVPCVLLVRGRAPWCLLPCLAVPMAVRQTRRLRESKTPSELIELLGDTGKLLALYAALLAAGIAA